MKKGFTLIELLAVIVILAIIALIATPVVLSIIEDARVNSDKRSIDFYGKAVSQAIARYQIKNTNINLEGSYSTSNDGKTLIKNDNNDIVINIDYEGSSVVCEDVIIQDKLKVNLSNCKVNDKSVDYSYGDESNNNSENEETCTVVNHKSFGNTCTYTDLDSSGSITKGDKVTCGTEGFYVIKNPENETVTMLAEWNLNVREDGELAPGLNYSYTYCESTVGYQDSHVRGSLDYENNSSLTDYMKYIEFAGESGYLPYGVVMFDGNTPGDYGYWASIMVTSHDDYVYDSNSTISTYVDEYTEYLNMAINGANATGRLIKNYSELKINLCGGVECELGKNCPDWIFQTDYWTGSAEHGEKESVCRVDPKGNIICNHNKFSGVRPVIEISASVIQASH